MKTIDDLIQTITRLNIGFGRTAAQRLIMTLLECDEAQVRSFGRQVLELRDKITHCKVCGCWAENGLCPICLDNSRDKSILCVVSNYDDINNLKRIKTYNGQFHILNTSIYPTKVIAGEDTSVNALIARIKNNGIKEVIFATDPVVERSGIPPYIESQLNMSGQPVKITKLAVGIPVGTPLSGVDEFTITSSIKNRTTI